MNGTQRIRPVKQVADGSRRSHRRLVMSGSVRSGECGATKDVVCEALLSVWLLKGLHPVERARGCERRVSEAAGTAGRGDKPTARCHASRSWRAPRRSCLGAVAATDEEPFLSPDGLAFQGALVGIIVMQGQPPIFEEARQRAPLIEAYPRAAAIGDSSKTLFRSPHTR